MKYLKAALCISILLVTNFAYGQTIPIEVKKRFDKKYPEASQDIWSTLEDRSGFQVNFLDGKKHKHAIFSQEGEWVQTTAIINTEEELPRIVRLTISETYPESAYNWMEWFESRDESYFTIAITSGTEEKEDLILTITKEGEIRSASKDNKDHHYR